MSIGYMNSEGVFKESVQGGSLPADTTLVIAPPGGAFGLKWNGNKWVEDERASMSCTRKQAMKALGEAAWVQIEAAISTLPWDTRVDFNASEVWERNNPLISQLATQLFKMSPDDIDNLFKKAMSLK